MENVKNKILQKLELMEKSNKEKIELLSKTAKVTDYRFLVREESKHEIWSDAFQKAIDENEIVIIPSKETPYYIDKSIIIPSNRHIEAENGAVMRQVEGTRVLMLRNSSTANGAKLPIKDIKKDSNISIRGGRWEENRTRRGGYGRSGMYDEERSFFGVSTCMFFNNMENLTLQNLTFEHAGGFAIQIGDIKDILIENISFEECFADGVHINGNTENIIARNIEGKVGDDLVALNMYDWQDSSVNFGPLKTALCENLRLLPGSRYKALRILPGTYYYEDGSSVDCSLNDVIIRNVKGINTFKLYFQTPPYDIGRQREKGNVGSGSNIFFDNIDIDLDAPIDALDEYENSDSIRGNFAAFEIGADIGNLYLENINLTLYEDKYPLSCLLCCGPKSAILNGREVFDPYINTTVEKIFMKNICINGKKLNSLAEQIRTVTFKDINNDGNSSGRGIIKAVEL